MTPTPWLDERFRRLTPRLLAELSAEELGDAIVQHVALQVGDDASRTKHVIGRLPPGVRAIYATWLVDAEVKNGGFNQFFYNPSGAYAEDALAGYELLDAPEYAAVLRNAIAIYEAEQPGLAPLHDAGTLEAFSESYRHTKLGEADERYYALGDRIYDLWATAVRNRPQDFA